MASVARIPYVSVETYLGAGDLQPDMDYVDGVLEERNLGEFDHADLQGVLYAYFRNHRSLWHVKPYVEARVQIAPTRFRVPDVCIMPMEWKKTPVALEPPVLCLEVLSESDTLSRQRVRAQDFLAMGVREVWIFDPAERRAYVLSDRGFAEANEPLLRLAGTAIELPLADIFAAIDE